MTKIIKDNKEFIVFLIIMTILVVAWVNHVEKTNNEITNIKNNQVERWSK